MADVPPPLPAADSSIDPLAVALRASPEPQAVVSPSSPPGPPPLPSASAAPTAVPLALDDVLITGEREKLPPAVAALLDPAVPLPPGVTFFEQRITIGDMLFSGLWAAGLAVVGLVCVIFGVAEIIHPVGPVTVNSGPSYLPLGFGLVCWVGTWLMTAAIPTQFRLRAAQLAGTPTRVGILLTPDVLIHAAAIDTTILPRPAFRGLDGRDLRYVLKDQPKSLRLPGDFIGTTADVVMNAVKRWSGASGV